MKKIYLLTAVLCGFITLAQTENSSKNSGRIKLYVAFEKDAVIGESRLLENVKINLPETFSKISSVGNSFLPAINFAKSPSRNLSDKSIASFENLKNIFVFKFQNLSNTEVESISAEIKKLKGVRYCSIDNGISPKPPGDILPITPSYEPQQTYLDANPGVNMRFAWNLGLTGSGIRVRDIEYAFNKNHEEFTDNPNISIAPGMVLNDQALQYKDHGTGVFGVVIADHGDYGISGMAYGASEMILFPEWIDSGYDRINAITQAIDNSVEGDVIIFEMQQYGQNNQPVPAEYEPVAWDLTKAATDAGIVIVAAAGNGNQDLDSAFYTEYMSRGNSGAILVGGGTPNLAHNKISYSTFGSRVDLQGWASNVLSTGYGTFSEIGGDVNQRYVMFSGTSSANPMVASCAIVLQSYYHSITDEYLTGAQLASIMKSTGIPQGTGGNIGPLPNMENAIAAINQLSTKDFKEGSVMIFPNPMQRFVEIKSETINDNASVSIFNAIGQKVYGGNFGESQTVDVSEFAKGIYILQINDAGKTISKKLIKK